MKIFELFLIVLVIALLVIAALLLKLQASAAGECVQQPLIYSAKAFTQANGKEVTCACYGANLAILWANSTSQSAQTPVSTSNSTALSYNLSKLLP